jgi:hypothetical protein
LENMSHSMLRPAEVCGALLAALEAAEGQRRKRKRDQTPDAIGLAIKRELLHRAVQENPNPETFEEWLLRCAQGCSAPESAGAVSAMARAIFDEWSLAHSMNEFKIWLDSGAPSDDANEGSHKRRRSEEPDSSPSDAPVSGAVANSCLCTVELFGVPRLLAKTKEISLSLPPEATLSDVYLALAAKLPMLLGRVISPDGNGLSSGYACNVNGLDFVRTPTAKVNSGDRIFILSADAGG